MSPPPLRVRGLCVGPRERRVLDGIDLTVEAGHFLGIVGPNGAGKSTLLHAIVGLVEPDAGRVELFGEPLTRFNRRRLLRRAGFLNQKQETPSTLPLSARDVVMMGLPEWNAPLWRRVWAGESVTRALEMTETANLAGRDFRTLSGGQKQRVRLARALASDPDLLLLDEPSAALDTHARDMLYALLRRLCDERGVAVVMVEHDIAAISGHVDSVACLNVRIHHHAMHGERIPESIWRAMYGEHMHVVAHDSHCIGCHNGEET